MTTDRDDRVVVRLATGSQTVVPITAVIGHYVIHPRVEMARAIGPGWAVTHRPSGILVWATPEREGAEAVARWLLEHNTIPDTKDVTAWRDRLTHSAYRRLLAQLESIAPRYLPPPVKLNAE